MADKHYETKINNSVYDEKIEQIDISPTEAIVKFVNGAKFEYATDKEFLRRLKRKGYTLLRRRKLG